MLDASTIKYYRELAVEVLRKNPFGHRKIRGGLKGFKDGEYCAVGELGYAFHAAPVDIASTNQVYDIVAEKLGEKDTSFIFHKNDMGQSWEEIADSLAKRWKLS